MNFRNAKALCLAALTAGLLLCAPAGYAQASKTPAQRLAAYEVTIASADPVGAAAYLNDPEAMTLAEADPQKAALTAKAQAIKDLKDLLAMPWDEAKANKLNQALTIRIDVDKPLAKLGVGPEPEKLLAWLQKFNPSYPGGKTAAVKKAIRQWEVVFGTMTSVQSVDWGQANMMNNASNVNVSKASWEHMVLRERNSVIAMLMTNDQAYIKYSDEVLASKKNEVTLSKSVDNVMAKLTPAQLAQVSGKPFNDQVYLLGSFFDGSNASGDPDIARIQAARSSMPKEVLPSQQRALLGGMLTTAVPKELAGTQAGGQVLAFYGKEGPLKIAVQPCDGAYSRYDPATRTIVLDSETIQQYMRMKGYTAESVMKNKDQVADIAKYMSPAVVYESGHQMQDTWARKQGVYKPHVQEDEIQAMSLEGMYTNEKLARDPAFKKTMDESSDYSSYAGKRVEIATEYNKRRAKGFATSVRERYFAGLPSLDSAASQVVDAISAEQSRRAAMSASDRAQIDATGLSLGEALDMSPEELAGSVGEIKGDALAKIKKDLTGIGAYRSYYEASDTGSRDALSGTRTGSTGRSAVPPAL
jgi:hypothetical protein